MDCWKELNIESFQSRKCSFPVPEYEILKNRFHRHKNKCGHQQVRGHDSFMDRGFRLKTRIVHNVDFYCPSMLTYSPCRPPLPELNNYCCASKLLAFEIRNGRVYKHGSALKERSSSWRQPFVTIASQQTWLKHERCRFTWSGDVSSFHVNSSYYGRRNLVKCLTMKESNAHDVQPIYRDPY